MRDGEDERMESRTIELVDINGVVDGLGVIIVWDVRDAMKVSGVEGRDEEGMDNKVVSRGLARGTGVDDTTDSVRTVSSRFFRRFLIEQ